MSDKKEVVNPIESLSKKLVEEQLLAYNNRNIDQFLHPFSKNVKVYTYPNQLEYEGIDNMRSIYCSKFKNTPDLHCQLISRIVRKNIVIDEEFVTANKQKFKAVAIYEINNNKIDIVRFIR